MHTREPSTVSIRILDTLWHFTPALAEGSHPVMRKCLVKHLSKAVLALFLVFGLSFPALATVINFDSLSGGPIYGGEQVTTQYSGLGVTFIDSFSGGARANNTLTSQLYGSSAPNVLWVDQGSGNYTGQYLEIDFSNKINRFSTVFETSLSSNITFVAYSGSTVLGAQTLTGTPFGSLLSGSIGFDSISDITSVRIFSNPIGSNTSFNFAIDNVTISAVPVPAAAVLFGSGLVGLIGLARRRKAT